MTTLTGLAAVAVMVLAGGSAFAVSGGGYTSPNQDCPWYGSDWATPPNQTYPGCHDAQLSIESGGMTNGNPNDGYNNSPTHGDHGKRNTTWVQAGLDQTPNDPNAKGTPGLLSVGLPGQSTSPHAGCISVNTDGTNGGAVPAGSKPTSQSKANSQQKYGCGDNPDGYGFALTYDYYSVYCPAAGATPLACANPTTDPAQNKLTVDKGGKQNLTDIATKGVILYFGMDDNFDNGEHDGVGPFSHSKLAGGAMNGPSDGGAEVISLTPGTATKTPSLTNPEGLVNESLGFCADGNCIAVTTQKETVYQGCNANTGGQASEDKCPAGRQNSQRDAYDYSGKKWDPQNCSSGGGAGQNPEPDSPQACDTSKSNPSPTGSSNPNGGMDYWRQQEAHNVNAEPGVQFYEDPDPEGSPEPFFPNPALYAGTCGVVAGGGVAPAAPASPVTNSAGQVDVSTGC